MGDANFTKLLSPELIPEPLRENGIDIERYTKKLYDYLRRLTSSLAIGISQNIIGSADELVKVSSDDTTARTLQEKITSVDGSVTITEGNEGGDETLDLSVSILNDIFTTVSFVLANGTTYLDARDWRGRMVEWLLANADQTQNPFEDWMMNMTASVQAFRAGSNFNFQNGHPGPNGDYQFTNISYGSISAQLFIEDATGKIKIVVSGVTGVFPNIGVTCKLQLRAGPVF